MKISRHSIRFFVLITTMLVTISGFSTAIGNTYSTISKDNNIGNCDTITALERERERTTHATPSIHFIKDELSNTLLVVSTENNMDWSNVKYKKGSSWRNVPGHTQGEIAVGDSIVSDTQQVELLWMPTNAPLGRWTFSSIQQKSQPDYSNTEIEEMRGRSQDVTPEWTYSDGTGVISVAVSGNGEYIAAKTASNIILFDKDSSSPLWMKSTGNNMGYVAVSSDASYIAVSAYNELRLYNRNGGLLWTRTTGGFILSVAMSTNGEYTVIGCDDNKVYFFDKDSSTPQWTYTAGGDVNSVDISDNGNYMIAGSSDAKVYCFTKSSGTPEWIYSDSDGYFDTESVAISSNGINMVAGDTDGDIYLFYIATAPTPEGSYATGSYIRGIDMEGFIIAAGAGNSNLYRFLFTPTSLIPFGYYSEATAPYNQVCMPDDGLPILGACDSPDNHIRCPALWHYQTGALVYSVATSDSGEQVAGGGNDKKIYFFDMNTITFYTNPSTGGTITFDDDEYEHSNQTSRPDGTYSITATPPPNYNFDHWASTGGIDIDNPYGASTTATISGDGSITAYFDTNTITFYTDPTNGGTITFDGSTYSNGQSTQKPDGNYACIANPSSGYSFNHWTDSGGVSIINEFDPTTTADVNGDGSVKAWFVEDPILCYDPDTIHFGSHEQGWTGYDTFEIWNCGGGTLHYDLSEGLSWIDASPDGGQSTGEHDTITVEVMNTDSMSGYYSGNIHIDTDEDGSGNVFVDITIYEEPEIQLTPESHDFGQVLVDGCSEEFTFTLKNIGGGTAEGDVSLSGEHATQFDITQGQGYFSLGAGATKPIKVKFCPTSLGYKNALVFADGWGACNDDDSHIYGEGILSPPYLVLEPDMADFEDTYVGETSSTKFFTLTNTGDTTATGDVYLTGTDPNQFTIQQGGGPFVLGPGAYIPIEVTFDPDTPGEKSALLKADGDDPCNDDTSTLTGTALSHPPAIPTFEGPTFGYLGTKITFTIVTSDPDPGDQVYYRIDWDDDTGVDWIGPYPSGQEIEVEHTWTSTGVKDVIAQAKDTHETESGWSSPFPVTIYDPYDIPHYAVVIGEWNYPGSENDIYESFCNADSIQKFLGKTNEWTNTVFHTNRGAAGIIDDLTWMKDQEDEGSLSLFYYSGHGTQVTDDDPDEEADDLDEALFCSDEELIRDDELKDILSQFEGPVVVILEACNSGGFGEIEQDNVVLMAACNETEDSHVLAMLSVFTNFIRLGWNGDADVDGNDKITDEETFVFARDHTLDYAQGEPWTQTPLYFDGYEGNIPLIISGFGTNIPPDVPFDPSPYDGEEGVPLEVEISCMVTDPNGDDLTVAFFWEDGTFIGVDTDVASGERASVMASGLQQGMTYFWYAMVSDGVDITESPLWQFTTEGDTNNPPETPLTPEGCTHVYVGYEWEYETSTTDPEGHNVFYKWEWGDETTGWIGPYSSGEIATEANLWDNLGEYNIQVKARDDPDGDGDPGDGKESEWSEALLVSVNRPGDINGDDVVDVNDLLALLGQWGQTEGLADINNDGIVNVNDLLILLANWGGESDTTPPPAPVISSPTHPDEGQWYDNNDPLFEWTIPDDPSGIAGYSYVLDQSSSTTPDTTIDTTGNSKSYTNVDDGIFWFHVRAQDNADNWGAADHFKVQIDTNNPPAPVISSPTHPDEGQWYDNNSPHFEWTTPDDLSGIVGYSYVLDQSSSTIPDTTIDTTGNYKFYNDIDDGIWWFHVRAVDNAENWGTTDHYKVKIDVHNPPAPVISSPTHPDEGQWYDNNDPLFEWTIPDDPSGIAGYSYDFDHSSSTTPDTSIDMTGTVKPYYDVDDGIWWFHVRAVDNADNWGATDHYKVMIDTCDPGWISPNDYDDPYGEWVDEPDAYDGDTDTKAKCTVWDSGDWFWTDPLDLLLPEPITSNKIRFWAWYDDDYAFCHCRAAKVKIHADDGWHTVHDGEFVDRDWEYVSFSTLTNVDKVRISFEVRRWTWPSVTADLHEFEFYKVC